MNKVILGILFLVILIVGMIGNFFNDNQTESDLLDEQQLSGGGMIMPKEAADIQGVQPGETAIDFELETIDGEFVKLSDLQGEKVILNFWASWCPPCKKEMPEMQEFHDKYGDKVKIIAVNYRETDDKVIEFLDEYQYTFTSLLDRDGTVGDDYGVLSLPTTYFIGTDGKIQQPRHIGPMTYEFMEDMMHTLN